MIGRAYKVLFQDVAVAAAQDLFNIVAAANFPLLIDEISLAQRGLTVWEAKPITFRRFPATVTSGSGGGTATPRPENNSVGAANASARINDTTLATTSGTGVIHHADQFHFLLGFTFAWHPDEPLLIPAGHNLIVRLDSAPSASSNMSGHVKFREVG